jgi:hypothetical protein
VHVLGPFLDQHASGQPLFKGITAASALGMLRDLLGAMQVPDSDKYRTHDLRRGHAKDLQLSGESVYKDADLYYARARVLCEARRCMSSWRPANGPRPLS